MNWNYFTILLTQACLCLGIVAVLLRLTIEDEPAPEIPTGPAAEAGEWPLHVRPPGEHHPISSRDYLLQVAAEFMHPFTARQLAALTLDIQESDVSHQQAMVAANLLRGAGYRRTILQPTPERRGGVFFYRPEAGEALDIPGGA